MKLYFWEDVDFGLYYHGHVIAIAKSFGEACAFAANKHSEKFPQGERISACDTIRNKLLQLQPTIVNDLEGFAFVYEGQDG